MSRSPECLEPGECGTTCYCGDYVEGHGTAGDSHIAVPMECAACDPPVPCPKCEEEVSRVYAHLHTCPPDGALECPVCKRRIAVEEDGRFAPHAGGTGRASCRGSYEVAITDEERALDPADLSTMRGTDR